MNTDKTIKNILPVQVGNGAPHSPFGLQIDSDAPFKPCPGGQENAARPPTSRDKIATLGLVPFVAGGRETSPHSTPLMCKF